ncbi:hypothetical protein IMCC26134_00675 [Verrucomicrobia bacterium IMCC26134]|jgi:hypothetical protein|nr:hypothetical protein IMCC26134_00675 [Verrucomicrobia bacterium IMCC26134]
MMATLLFTLATGGLLAALTQSYRMGERVKYSSEARYALRTIADLFLNAPYSKGQYNDMDTLFMVTSGPTGSGMAWRKDLGIFCFLNQKMARQGTESVEQNKTRIRLGYDISSTGVDPDTGATGEVMIFHLGKMDDTTMSRMRPRVTRDISIIATDPSPAGILLKGEFVVSYELGGKTYTQAITVLRAAP